MTDAPATAVGDTAGPAGDAPSPPGGPRRRAYVVLAAAAVIALAAVALTASRLAAPPPGQGGSAASIQPGATPRPAFYLGVYEATSPRSYAGVMDFGRVAGGSLI